MARLGSRGEIRSPLTKFQWLFRYPRSESDCMTWSFPRQINLPPIRSSREATPHIAQLAVATAARPRSPIVRAFPSVRDGVLLFTSSPGQAYSQPPTGSGLGG
jgi:hypothetical protein